MEENSNKNGSKLLSSVDKPNSFELKKILSEALSVFDNFLI